MKWFKHDTDAMLSEGLSQFFELQGWAGLGRWYRLLEIIAAKMDETDNTSVTYSINKWCSLLGLKPNNLQMFVGYLSNVCKTNVKRSDNLLTIDIPNLLTKRDNQTLRKVKTSRSKTKKDRLEVEVDKDKDKEKDKEKQPTNFSKPFQETFDAYIQMRKKIKKPITNHGKDLIIKNLEKLSVNEKTQIAILEQSIANSWAGVFPLKQDKGKISW